MFSTLESYRDSFQNAKLSRSDGILELQLHTDGGHFVFSEAAHRELGFLFDAIAHDAENKVLIITGTGDRFCASFDYSGFYDLFGERGMSEGNAQVMRDGRHLLESLLKIEIPVIAAVNGPCVSHSEIPLLSDVVLASETAFFQDPTHFISGVTPGDGMHTVWTALLGLNRGRYFLMTGQKIGAQEAWRLGVVGEVLPPDRLLERAWELARHWARLPAAVLRGSRRVLTLEWQRLIRDQLDYGLVQETLGLIGTPPTGEGPTFVDLMDIPGLAADAGK